MVGVQLKSMKNSLGPPANDVLLDPAGETVIMSSILSAKIYGKLSLRQIGSAMFGTTFYTVARVGLP